MNRTVQRGNQNMWGQMRINTVAQNTWHAAKVVIRGKFLAIQAYLKKQE